MPIDDREIRSVSDLIGLEFLNLIERGIDRNDPRSAEKSVRALLMYLRSDLRKQASRQHRAETANAEVRRRIDDVSTVARNCNCESLRTLLLHLIDQIAENRAETLNLKIEQAHLQTHVSKYRTECGALRPHPH